MCFRSYPDSSTPHFHIKAIVCELHTGTAPWGDGNLDIWAARVGSSLSYTRQVM
jgi:hypothetical protein